MRVLFTCVVGHGHFNPMVPLAAAIRSAGHDVAFATDPGFAGHVRSVGFDAFGAGLDMAEALRRMARNVPNWRDVAPWDRAGYIVPLVFAGERIEPMLGDLEPILSDWRPDLLIHDSAEMAGAIAAEQAGIVHAEHSFGIYRLPELQAKAIAALEPICERLGVRNTGVGGLGGELYIDICPPGIQRPEIAAIPRCQPLRPVGFDEAPEAVLPTWLPPVLPRPLVYVTMGTEFNKQPAIFRAILEGLGGTPYDVVVTVGVSGDPDALGSWPDNVRIERFVPQSKLLPRCSAFVSHGGSGALLGALNASVPMLAIPQGADQFTNAERIVETGIGLRLLPPEFEPATVRDAVRALVEDPRYRESIRSQRSAIDAMPSPEEVVPILEAMV